MTGIYGIYNTASRKWYVGQAVDITKRFRQHKAMLRSGNHKNKHLQSAYTKYGAGAFEFVILELCEPAELNSKEKLWVIAQSSFCAGYNNTEGGDGVLGLKMSDATRQKMSDARKGRKATESTRLSIKEAHKNSESVAKNMERLRNLKLSRPATDREKAHLSALNDKRKKMVLCVETGQTFSSAHAAAEAIGSYQSNISFCCRNNEKTHKGFHWRYVNEQQQSAQAV